MFFKRAKQGKSKSGEPETVAAYRGVRGRASARRRPQV